MIRESIMLIISRELDITNTKAKQLLADFLECLEQVILKEKKVLFSGFGSFEIRERKRIIGRNPKTMEEVIVPPRKALCLKASMKLKKFINETE